MKGIILKGGRCSDALSLYGIVRHPMYTAPNLTPMTPLPSARAKIAKEMIKTKKKQSQVTFRLILNVGSLVCSSATSARYEPSPHLLSTDVHMSSVVSQQSSFCTDMHKASPYSCNRPFGVYKNVVDGTCFMHARKPFDPFAPNRIVQVDYIFKTETRWSQCVILFRHLSDNLQSSVAPFGASLSVWDNRKHGHGRDCGEGHSA